MLSQRSLGAAKKAFPSDDEFNTVSFLSHFDGANNGVNNVFDDGSASNHTITANGNVTQGSFGPFARPDGEWGWSFDGDGDYLTLAASSDFAPGTGAYTVEFFINTTAVSGWLFYNAANDTGIRICIGSNGGSGNDGKIQINEQVGNTDNITNGSTRIDDGQWHHVAISRVASAATKIYIDGTLDATGAADLNLASGSNNLEIGRRTNNGGVSFLGTLSNLRFVKGTGIYTGNFTPSTSPLTAVTNTKLLTCQSNRFVDNSASAHTITPSGTASVSAFGPFLTSKVYDPAVNAASAFFDGTDDALTGPTSSDFQFGDNSFTVECFIFPTLLRNYCSTITCSGSTGAGRWYISYGVTSMYWGTYGNGTDGDLIVTHGMAPNAWYHLAYVRNKSDDKGRLYINGVQKGVWDDARTYGNPSNPLRLGKDHFTDRNNNMVGYISDARVVNGTSVYTAAFTPPTAPLTAITNTKLLLNMADGQAIDSAAQNNLTLYGNAKLSTTQAKFGDTSIYFDGTGDYAYVYPKYFTFGTGDFTVEFQVYFNSTALQSILSFLSADDTVAPHFYYHNSIINFYVGDVGVPIASGTINTGQWYHVALSRSGTSSKLFIDGTQAGNTYSDSNNYVAGPLSLGTYKWPTPSTASMLNGYIDEVRISTGVARYTSNFTAPTEPFLDRGE